MNISLIIVARIKELMERDKVSLRKLSESIGISHPTLKKYVEGEQPIDSEKLSLIANYFNKPFDYFFKNKDSNFKFMFRADNPSNTVTKNDIYLFEQNIENYLDIVGNQGARYVPPKYTFEGVIENEIYAYLESIANEQRRLAKIEHIVPQNYFEALESIGIHVITKKFTNSTCYGVSSFSEEFGGIILINDDPHISEERKIFSLIHEFAHLLFHRNQYSEDASSALYNSSRNDKFEKMADKFAGYYLMPRNMVKKFIGSNKHIDKKEMKKHFKVSMQTLYLMLHAYGYISREDYKAFWAVTSKEGTRKTEPYPMDKLTMDQKNGRLIRSIKERYYKDEITANKISEVLGIDVLSTRQLLKEWKTLDEGYLSLR